MTNLLNLRTWVQNILRNWSYLPWLQFRLSSDCTVSHCDRNSFHQQFGDYRFNDHYSRVYHCSICRFCVTWFNIIPVLERRQKKNNNIIILYLLYNLYPDIAYLLFFISTWIKSTVERSDDITLILTKLRLEKMLFKDHE